MKVKILGFGMLLGSMALAAQHADEEKSPFQIRDTDEGVLVQESGKKVLFYQQRPRSIAGEYERSNYIHPLYGLDGEILTEDFPRDHLHHRGVFWAWHHVSVGGKKIGDPWEARDFRWGLARPVVARVLGWVRDYTRNRAGSLEFADIRPAARCQQRHCLMILPTSSPSSPLRRRRSVAPSKAGRGSRGSPGSGQEDGWRRRSACAQSNAGRSYHNASPHIVYGSLTSWADDNRL